MCCLIKLHVNMLTFFKRLLTKEYANAKGENEKILLNLECENNRDGIITIIMHDINIYLFIYFVSKMIRCDFLQLCKIMCGANVKVCYDFGNDPMKMCFEHKIRLKVDHIIKDIIILFSHVDMIFYEAYFAMNF